MTLNTPKDPGNSDIYLFGWFKKILMFYENAPKTDAYG